MRELTSDDRELLFAMVNQPDVNRYLYAPYMVAEPHLGVSEPEKFRRDALAGLKRRAMEVPRSSYELAAVEISSNKVIGMGNLGLTGSTGLVAEIGYFIDSQYWGRGFGTEIASSLIDFGFSELHLHRIWAGHHPDNPASGAILSKIGMSLEGRLRDEEILHGEWRDSLIYSILEHEWPIH